MVDERIYKLSWRGGVLADEMGLGSTSYPFIYLAA